MNLIIDTNTLLSFYHFSSDDLEELKKLAGLLREGKLRLFLPEQVQIEFRRNRPTKIADALDRLRGQHLNLEFPQLSKDYEEYEKLREAQKQYEKYHAQLINKIEQDVSTHNLKADAIIEELFQLAEVIPTSDTLIQRARLRMDVGNPPGKKGSLGDAIVWESLLEKVRPSHDLYIITDDGDYFSPLDNESLHPFLVEEWQEAKHSQIICYKRLSKFFRDKYPEIELASETEKDLLIRELAVSNTFARTHEVISDLSKYSDFTPSQLNEIVTAAVSNNQVYLIINDSDVSSFLTRAVEGREHQLNPDYLKQLHNMLEAKVEEDEVPSEEEIPF